LKSSATGGGARVTANQIESAFYDATPALGLDDLRAVNEYKVLLELAPDFQRSVVAVDAVYFKARRRPSRRNAAHGDNATPRSGLRRAAGGTSSGAGLRRARRRRHCDGRTVVPL